MNLANETEHGQKAFWNGVSGQGWATTQELLDRMFQPFEDRLVEEVAATPSNHVLDVGCGAGATTLAIARKLGTRGQCTGIDISEPLIAVARERAEREDIRAGFLQADAQRYDFERASFDMIVSRFGVMFFDDPVAAFRNLRRAVRGGGELRCIAWRSPSANPFMTAAERAAAPLLQLPAPQTDQPGPFAFADAERVRRILGESGWAQIEVRSMDIVCSIPKSDLPVYLERIGPVGRALQETDAETRERILQLVRPAFAPFEHGTEVRFTAACWLVGASAPSLPDARRDAEYA